MVSKATQEVDNSAIGKFKMGRVLGGQWMIAQKLDEGGFGNVYKVKNTKDPKLVAALKVEPSNSDEWNHLKMETDVLKKLHANGFRAHVPQLFRSAKRHSYCYMIITLLGENLLKLKYRLFPRGMPLRTWTRVAVQCLYGIKTVHDGGFVHRDIKPQNFVIGCAASSAVARVVYIIDFGLARLYAHSPDAKCRKWIARKARASLEFRGTYRYAAPAMHEEKEQGRKDDIWAWLYMVMDLYCGLPWVDEDDRRTLEKKKLHIKDEDLMIRMPVETKFIPKHLRSLNVYQRPDYLKIYRALETVRKGTKTTYKDPYEWESTEAAAANKKAMREKQAPIGYANAEVFFKSDPVGIKAAPSAKDEQVLADRAAQEMREKKKPKPEMLVLEDVLAISVKPPQKPPSPEKRTVETPPTAPKSPGGVQPLQQQQPKKKSTEKSVEDKKETKECKRSRPLTTRISVATKKTASTKSKQSKKSRASKQDGGSLEESDDFVPSCYMNVDIPLHYLQAQNDTARDFQRKMVGMDWGHAEPYKPAFKEVFSPTMSQSSATSLNLQPAAAQSSYELLQPLPAAAQQSLSQSDVPSELLLPQHQTQQQQQDSSGPRSDSQGQDSTKESAPPPSFKSSAEVVPEKSKSSVASPSCQASCIVHDQATNKPSPSSARLEQQPSSNSNNSISLIGPYGCDQPSQSK